MVLVHRSLGRTVCVASPVLTIGTTIQTLLRNSTSFPIITWVAIPLTTTGANSLNSRRKWYNRMECCVQPADHRSYNRQVHRIYKFHRRYLLLYHNVRRRHRSQYHSNWSSPADHQLLTNIYISIFTYSVLTVRYSRPIQGGTAECFLQHKLKYIYECNTWQRDN